MLLLRRLLSFFILLGLFTGGAFAYTYLNPLSFPDLTAGVFHGTLHLDAENLDRPFVAQVVEGTLPELQLMFLDSTGGQLVMPLERVKPFWFEHLFNSVDSVIAPPLLALGEQTYELRGRASGDLLKGYLVQNDVKQGRWTLMRGELPNFPASELQNPEVIASLQAEARLRILQEELRTVRERVREQEQTVEKTKDFIKDEHALKVRAEEQRAKLLADVTTLREERKHGSQDIARLSAELNLLGRITKRGRITELARKVAARENKWYFVNWHAEEDQSGAEEYLDEEYGGQLQNLRADYQRASEIKRLHQEIQDEQNRIRELEAQIMPPSEPQADRDLRPRRRRGGFFGGWFGDN